ncbi:MAG TPA: hypothetical protein VMT30_04425 [Candidatus Saccharimonadia bacterium]|nr:hypothetical protein [Candidatus Saccharimonadia bacterium]
MSLEHTSFAMLGFGFFADEAVRCTAHPVAHLGVADFGADDAAHDVAEFIFGAFGFEDFRFFAG